mgnify:CR=1 FL=1
MLSLIEKKQIDEFRDARRRSEYEGLIRELPRDICNIILDYSQLDDRVPHRIMNMCIRDCNITICSCSPFNNKSRIHLNLIIFDDYISIEYTFADIFASCYDDLKFANYLASIISIRIHEDKTEVLRFVRTNIIEFIRWPNA